MAKESIIDRFRNTLRRKEISNSTPFTYGNPPKTIHEYFVDGTEEEVVEAFNTFLKQEILAGRIEIKLDEQKV